MNLDPVVDRHVGCEQRRAGTDRRSALGADHDMVVALVMPHIGGVAIELPAMFLDGKR